MTTFETLSLAIGSAGLLGVICATWLAVKNLRLIVQAHADDHEWNRRIATQNAVARIRDLNIDSLNIEFGYANQLTSIPLDTVLKKFEENPALQIVCHKLLNEYEGIASGVHLGIYDELTVKINRRGAIERDFAKFREYISMRRDVVNQTLFIEQEKLITKWREETLDQSSRETTGNIS